MQTFESTVSIENGRLAVQFPSALLESIGAGEGTVLEATSFPSISVFIIGSPSALNALQFRLASLGLGVTIN